MPTDRLDSPPYLRAAALLFAWLLPTAWLGWHHTQLTVDTDNTALKSTDTAAARDLERVRAAFGSDRALLLGIVAAPGLSLVANERTAIDGIIASLGERDDVRAVRAVPTNDDGFCCLHVVLQDPATPAAAVVDAVRAALPPTLSLEATGPALAENAIASALTSERRRIVPLITGVMVALLAVLYGSLRVAMLVIVPAGGAIACTGGLLALAGHALDPVSTLLDPVVLTVGIAMNVHVAESYLRHRRHRSPAAAADQARRELTVPTVLSTLTTMVGFLALTCSPIPAVGRFGVYAAFGVAAVATTSMTCLPTWLAATVPPLRQAEPRAPTTYVVWLARHRSRILAATAAVGIAAAAGLPNIELDNDPLRVLPAADRFRTEHDELVRRLGSVETFDLWAPSAAQRNAALPVLLAAVATSDEPLVLGPSAPPQQSAVDDSLLVPFGLAPSGSRDRERLFDRIEDRLIDHGFDDVRVVGSPVQIARDSGELIRSQLWSWLLVVPLLATVVALGFRSWRLAALSLLPNILPAVLSYGAMAWSHRPLSVATVMIGSTLMAVIVDDTIHLLHHYAVSRRAGRPTANAIRFSLQRVGRAVTTTSTVLALGLGAGAMGDLETTIEFSTLAAATIVLAWILDVVLLPALLLRPRYRLQHA